MAMRAPRTDLSFTLSKINEASDQVAAGSEQLAEGAQVLAEGANQIGKLAADSAQSAVNTRELIEKSLVEVEHGNEITSKTVEALNEILESL